MDADSSGSSIRRDSQGSNRRNTNDERRRKYELEKVPSITDDHRDHGRPRALQGRSRKRTPSPTSTSTIRSRIRYRSRSNDRRRYSHLDAEKIPYFADVRRERDRVRTLQDRSRNRTPSPTSTTTIRSRIRYRSRSNDKRRCSHVDAEKITYFGDVHRERDRVHTLQGRSRNRTPSLPSSSVSHARRSKSRSWERERDWSIQRRHSPRSNRSNTPQIIPIPVPVPAADYVYNYGWPLQPIPYGAHPPQYMGGRMPPPPYSLGSTFARLRGFFPGRSPYRHYPPSRFTYHRHPPS